MAENTPLQSIRQSFIESVGDIVFGMEDGTVSIFGLVAGVSLSADNSQQVLLAGAAGAIAASVSMMAGVFLDLQSEQDQVKVQNRKRQMAIQQHPQQVIDTLMERLQHSDLSQSTLTAIQTDLQTDPHRIATLAAVLQPSNTGDQKDLLGHALWMFVSDLFAGLTPVIAFMFFPLEQARWICIAMTLALLILLGYGRARLGQRRVFPTILQTVSIAVMAAIAGVVIGRLIVRFA
jgi:VIT1/CCC1 family predicted Fe2+/Mn2+ transporter